MSHVSWGDIFTLLLRGDRIMELRHNSASDWTRALASSRLCAASTKHSSPSSSTSPTTLRMQKGWRIPHSNWGQSTRRDNGTIIASIWRVGNRCANYKRRRELPSKAHLPTVCNPACPSCFDPALPTQITSHRTESSGSSAMSSTICPRLRLKLPRNLKPSCDLSTMRQGNIFWPPLRSMTRLARFFVTIRLDRRPPGIGECSTVFPRAPAIGRIEPKRDAPCENTNAPLCSPSRIEEDPDALLRFYRTLLVQPLWLSGVR